MCVLKHRTNSSHTTLKICQTSELTMYFSLFYLIADISVEIMHFLRQRLNFQFLLSRLQYVFFINFAQARGYNEVFSSMEIRRLFKALLSHQHMNNISVNPKHRDSNSLMRKGHFPFLRGDPPNKFNQKVSFTCNAWTIDYLWLLFCIFVLIRRL